MVKRVHHHTELANIILGGQDGLVNILGLALGLVAAGSPDRVVLAGGLAATFAEAISMGGVAYTSKTADRDLRTVEGTSDGAQSESIGSQSLIVGMATLVGSLLPLIPFFLSAGWVAAWWSISLCAVTLFIVGIYKARLTSQSIVRSAGQLLLIGLGSAVAGYVIGLIFKP